MTTTHISEYEIKARSFGQVQPTTIVLNLPEVAPVLLEKALHPELLASPAMPMPKAGPEFQTAVMRRYNDLTTETDVVKSGPSREHLVMVYADLIESDCTEMSVTAGLDLIALCERNAVIYEKCSEIVKVERQRRRIAAAGPGCGVSWVKWQYAHVGQHHALMSAWLTLAAYLAARLDAIGRVVDADRQSRRDTLAHRTI